MEFKPPKLIDNLFSDDLYNSLVKDLSSKAISHGDNKTMPGRFLLDTDQSDVLQEAYDSLLTTARTIFESKTLLPSYALFAHYETIDGVVPRLKKHKDTNACTYTLDMCVYQTEPWELYVDDQPYTIYPNQALAYYGEAQEHWRNDFPELSSGPIGMAFFFFVEPDHWFYTKGSDYVEVINGTMTEEQWVASHK